MAHTERTRAARCATLCDFGDRDRIEVLSMHGSEDTARRRFKDLARGRASGGPNAAAWRVWTVAVESHAIQTGTALRPGDRGHASLKATAAIGDGRGGALDTAPPPRP